MCRHLTLHTKSSVPLKSVGLPEDVKSTMGLNLSRPGEEVLCFAIFVQFPSTALVPVTLAVYAVFPVVFFPCFTF